MQIRILVAGLFLILAIASCSDKQADKNAAAGSGEPQHVWKEQVKALDKAKRLEDDMNAAFEKRAKEIDAQAQ